MMTNSELSFEQLIALYPEQIWIEITEPDRVLAEQEVSTHRYTNDTARDRAFQNTLCLNLITAFLAEDPDLPPAEAWLESRDRAAIWEVVNGSILTVGNTRLTLIPTDGASVDVFKVEQEWLDIPDWAAHYYLAVQLNLEANWLRLVGYATHEQLQRPEHFNQSERVYCLGRSRLIEDLNVLWVAREVSPDWNPIVAPLPELFSTTATNLIAQLAPVTAYSPRLERSFSQWAPLIANPEWRRSLNQRRLDRLTPIAHLNRWLQTNLVEPGWRVVQDLTTIPQWETAEARGIRQGRQQTIVLGQETFNLIVIGESEGTRIEVATIVLQALGDRFLLDNLHLIVAELDALETEIPRLELVIPPNTSTFQLPTLTVNPGDRFALILRLGELQFRQNFTIEDSTSETSPE